MLTRREFVLGGAAAWAALARGRAFAAVAGALSGGGLRLRVGVLSDIHVSLLGAPDEDEMSGGKNARTFIKALSWYRDQRADAVLVAGDLTNSSFKSELLAVGEAWRQVFPNDRTPDGREVVRLFIAGNHEWEGWKYGKAGSKRFPNEADLRKNVFTFNEDAFWREAFGEPFEKFPYQEVKGYGFLGAHWPYHDEAGERLRACAARYPRRKPLFYFQHPHVRGTLLADTVRGCCDNGKLLPVLRKMPNVLVLSGHSHTSLTDERSVWQGGFTAINAGSLRFTACPSGRENGGPRRNSDFKAMPELGTQDCRQGLLMDVYDDRIVLARREFVTGLPLGPDWVIPLSAERPFEPSARAAAFDAPAFPVDAKVTVGEIGEGNARGGDKIPRLSVEFPQALPAEGRRSRVYDYRVEVRQILVVGADTYLVRRFVADGFNHGASDVPPRMRCVLCATEIPRECELEVEVRAANCFGALSDPISSGRFRLPGRVVRW